MTEATSKPRVIVVGGGYGGATIAQTLEADFDVTLVEPRDRFVHNVALLRALVEPGFRDKIVFSYDGLLSQGRVVHERAIAVEPGKVTLGSGKTLAADFIVLATGSSYAFPAKVDQDDIDGFFNRLEAARSALERASCPLLLGAGPVGIELAGEITSRWPNKKVTIIDPAETIVAGQFDERMRDMLREQLAERGVRVITGDSVELPDQPAGAYGDFEVTTRSGETIASDIWFKCFGGGPSSDYLAGNLRDLVDPSGHIRVAPTLQLEGVDRVFAIGDVTNLPESKRAGVTRMHSAVVAENIRDIASGKVPSAKYSPAPERMVVPLGPDGGAGFDGRDGGRVMGPDEVIEDKGTNLKTDGVARQFSAAKKAASAV